MKNKLVFLICTIVLAVITLLSCDKDKVPEEPTPCTTCQKVTEAKDYFAFKVGSWWVYEEETSLERDSMYVTSSTISDGYNFDTYIYSNYQNYFYHYNPIYINNLSGCHEITPVNKKCLYVNREKYKPGDYVGYSDCFFINYKVGDYATTGGDIFYCPNNKIIVESIFSTYPLFDTIYGHTVKIHELCCFIEGKQPTNHYYTKGIGIIRKEFLDSNKVWNLVNYHIEI